MGKRVWGAILVVLLGCFGCKTRGSASDMSSHGPETSLNQSIPPMAEGRNVYIRLHWHQRSPGIPDWEGDVEYWILGNRFRIRDGFGRYLHELREENDAVRGLGYQPKTLEEIMDITSRIGEGAPAEGTEIYYDGDAGEAWVREGDSQLHPVDATEVMGLCKPLFANGMEKQLKKGASGTQAGMDCVAFHGKVDGERDGQHFRNDCSLRIGGEFLLYGKMGAAESPDRFLEREVMEIVRGKVLAADVVPPLGK